jgi:hypothetical protein
MVSERLSLYKIQILPITAMMKLFCPSQIGYAPVTLI